MLWTDGQIVTADDLVKVDPEVQAVAASIDNLVIDGRDGIAQRAVDECAQDLIAQMQRFGGFFSGSLVSGNHLAAVFNVGGPGVNRSRIQLKQVVAFDPTLPVVKTWLVYRVLERFYHAAFARVTTNDRYESKMRMYRQECRWVHWATLKNIGLPIVYRPLSCPGAAFERVPNASALAGSTWSDANVTAIAASGAEERSVEIAITYVDTSLYRSPTIKVNAESYTSSRIKMELEADTTARIDITSLQPPTSDIDQAAISLAVTTGLNATGWNVYAGSPGGVLYLQNTTPIAIATKTYDLPLTLATTYPSDYGQYPDAFFTMQDTLQRG